MSSFATKEVNPQEDPQDPEKPPLIVDKESKPEQEEIKAKK